ncbi:MAG: bifunctional nuclease family protein [Ignavibacterium sp.]|uniref:bifunctional nuclease domain-containing protein n=1 Tax=Ignavibacterium sp. TaxID=2651167 RepID=UPI003299EFD7
MDKVQCEIVGLSSSPSTGGAYAILLKEIDGNRRLPIIIGHFEAQAIALEMEGIKPPRPLTHDLLKSVIDNLGGTVVEIVINELRENTFYAKIVLDVSGLTNEIDARPSDAMALAVRTDAPIYVAEAVMEAASFIPTDEAETDLTESFEEEKRPGESLPKSKEAQIAALQEKLREALEKEEYERAAKLRDDIKKLTQSN